MPRRDATLTGDLGSTQDEKSMQRELFKQFHEVAVERYGADSELARALSDVMARKPPKNSENRADGTDGHKRRERKAPR